MAIYLPPISFCFLFGFASWYWHIFLLSSSVKVRRGADPDRADDADTGVIEGVGDIVLACVGGTTVG